ncbi:MAG: HlyD family efflux transporter periplasmic adaptor subunit [Betaproteobacteria bacterium]|nr:MAG: HlyD family efflux transporter periplasmic adaptor subunit [Betaproteobacteria bacterium]TMH35367.1 MAG: HlyD family efflux transporter periplasmic adaptor subunit [Betaproteobacteria bacterium]
MPSLFRPEVIEGRQQAWLGSIQLVRPVPLAVLTLMVVIIAGAVGGFLLEGRYTRKAHIAGYLVPDRGVLRLLPPQAGVVTESHVVEGRAVRRGDVLFVLSIDRATLSGDTQAAVQASLAVRSKSLHDASRQKAQLQQEQRAALDRQIEDMRHELAQMDTEAELQRQRLVLAQQATARLESLKNDNFVSAAQVQAKTEEMLGVRAQLQALSRQRTAHLREIGTLEAQRRELPLRSMAAMGEIERDLASLAQESAENEAKQRVVIRAPQDGVVTAVLAEPGHSVSPASALASLLPADARLQAQLFAPSSAVGFVRANQQVQLRYQAFPYQKFGHHAGQVLQVSRTPLQAAELAGLPLPEAMKGAASAEPLYRITVDLDQQAVQAYGQAQPLAAGMQLEADVLLDRRRLIEWVFEPLLSVTGRI